MGTIYATGEDVGEWLKISPRRVQQMAAEGIIPKPKKRGRYDLKACVLAYVDFWRGQGTVDEEIDRFKEEARLIKYKADEQQKKVAYSNRVNELETSPNLVVFGKK
ncbi:MAG: hypothetical protein ACE5GQ_10390 [Nitrospinales bacterium]